MKPNDKAIEAALLAAKTVLRNDEITIDSAIFAALDAAYAAQFKSKDYADVIKSLRVMHDSIITDAKEQFRDGIHETMPSKAADAIEAVLAERDALNFELAARKEWPQARAEMLDELAKVRAERDALAARFAPVDDEALVKIAADAIETRTKLYGQARAAIAAIRPHIEAAERERCAKALEITSDEIRLHAGEMSAQEMRSVLAVLAWRAAAIRSGK